MQGRTPFTIKRHKYHYLPLSPMALFLYSLLPDISDLKDLPMECTSTSVGLAKNFL
jgi:hypothetical protein